MLKFSIKKIHKNYYLLNLLIWVTVLLLLSLTLGVKLSFRVVVGTLPAVYIHFYLLKSFFKKKKTVLYFILTALTVFAAAFCIEIITDYPTEKNLLIANKIYLTNNILDFRFVPLIAIIISTLVKHLLDKHNAELNAVIHDKIKTELDYLKSQINPHFFFNTLNTLYAMAITKGDNETANGISQLSELMRYIIYDTQNEYIELEKEIEHIHNYIELQKLRYSDEDKTVIDIKITGTPGKKKVPPMLFIPFIENAFKHGLTTKHKTEINIQINISSDEVRLVVKNPLIESRGKKLDQSGIGIANVTKRLNLLFKKEYFIEIGEKNNQFVVNLIIPVTK